MAVSARAGSGTTRDCQAPLPDRSSSRERTTCLWEVLRSVGSRSRRQRAQASTRPTRLDTTACCCRRREPRANTSPPLQLRFLIAQETPSVVAFAPVIFLDRPTNLAPTASRLLTTISTQLHVPFLPNPNSPSPLKQVSFLSSADTEAREWRRAQAR